MPNEIRRVRLHKGTLASAKLGIRLAGDEWPRIVSLAPDAIGARTVGLAVNDVILTVNGEIARGHAATTEMLKTAVGWISIELVTLQLSPEAATGGEVTEADMQGRPSCDSRSQPLAVTDADIAKQVTAARTATDATDAAFTAAKNATDAAAVDAAYAAAAETAAQKKAERARKKVNKLVSKPQSYEARGVDAARLAKDVEARAQVETVDVEMLQQMMEQRLQMSINDRVEERANSAAYELSLADEEKRHVGLNLRLAETRRQRILDGLAVHDFTLGEKLAAGRLAGAKYACPRCLRPFPKKQANMCDAHAWACTDLSPRVYPKFGIVTPQQPTAADPPRMTMSMYTPPCPRCLQLISNQPSNTCKAHSPTCTAGDSPRPSILHGLQKPPHTSFSAGATPGAQLPYAPPQHPSQHQQWQSHSPQHSVLPWPPPHMLQQPSMMTPPPHMLQQPSMMQPPLMMQPPHLQPSMMAPPPPWRRYTMPPLQAGYPLAGYPVAFTPPQPSSYCAPGHTHLPRSQAPTAASLAMLTLGEQREALGEILFPLVLARVGEHAGKVTGMLLQLADPGALLAMIQGPPPLLALDEAVAQATRKLEGHAA